ncbi:MAG: hypothetical protein KBT35_07825 [Firmicutes bacterium]|nr:hypothetical protein [Candidatus Colivicinus equi]
MKKLLVTLISIFMLFALVGCSNSKNEKEEKQEEMVGGYKLYDGEYNAELPEKAKEVFENTIKNLTGTTYDPIALLATQVVSGTNYAFFVREKPVTNFAVITVYADLKGNTQILKTYDIDLNLESDENSKDTSNLLGGWKAYDGENKCDIPDEAVEAVAKATEGLDGAGYTPIALLGTQVVSGINYAILCKETVVAAEPITTYSIVVVYKNTSGECKLTDVFNVKEYTVEREK